MAILGTAQVIIHIYTAVMGLRITRLAIEGDIWPSASVLGATSLYVLMSLTGTYMIPLYNGQCRSCRRKNTAIAIMCVFPHSQAY
ncbi:hypothetical protein C8R47DRAFT_1085714 [Mycena vitilis]|nr:hypothetical protein C8R47DRAFT_1085714 [Mycena vitilis]